MTRQRLSEENVGPTEQKYNFFFYGTLMAPAVLKRVLRHDCKDLTFQDARLPEYTRHCVKGQDYPAIISTEQRKQFLAQESKGQGITPDGETKGTLVKGLSFQDVRAIDIFEDEEYTRITVDVDVLGPSSVAGDKSTNVSSTKAQIEEAWVYVWNDDLSKLEPRIWSFEQFMKDKAHIWANQPIEEFSDIDAHHAGKSDPSVDAAAEALIKGKKVNGFEDFGHNMLKYYKFRKGITYMNVGSYGATPIPVVEATRKLADQVEAFPDIFMRRDWLPILNKCRAQVADVIGAKYDECVIVGNTTNGVNCITSNVRWKDGDVIVLYNTTYNAVEQTMKCVCDRNPGVTLEFIELEQPCSHATVVKKTEEVLAKYNEPVAAADVGSWNPKDKKMGKRVRMVVIDAITSNPGVVLPWEEVVGVCKKYGVISVVDAAHLIGQQKIDVKRADPDFMMTNCHKWMMSHRGSAVFYVPLRNQHIIRSSLPTSAGYESRRYPTEGVDRPWEFAKQWEWNGTQDWSTLLSITPAIEFRKSLGGEDRIMDYCHTLAVEGGKRLSKRWGTRVMDNDDPEDGILTAAMVNVALPDTPEPKDIEEQFEIATFLNNGMLDGGVYAPSYMHAGRWWARFSCQVWNELSDFDVVGDVLEDLCKRVGRGEHKNIHVAPTELLHEAHDLPEADL